MNDGGAQFIRRFPRWEPSLWAHQAITERLNRQPGIREAIAAAREAGMTMALALSEPEPGSPEDFTCDRCGADTNEGADMMHAEFSIVVEGVPALILAGLCLDCASRETAQ